MISFRHHVVSLIAVLLALAAGVVLGGGPLAAVSDQVSPESTAADDEDGPSHAQADYADTLAASVAETAYADLLDGVPVSLLVMPGADDATVRTLEEQIALAGGSIGGRWLVQDALVTPSEKTLVDSLGSQLATQQAKDDVPAGATTYDRIGQLIGLAIATPQDKAQPADGAAATVAESLDAGRLLLADGEVKARSPYVVVVLGDDTPVEEDGLYQDLVSGLAAQSKGVVVASSAADAESGRLSRLRESAAADEVATVDGVDTTSGAVTAVLALTRWPDTRGGRFGAVGADGAVALR